MIIPKIPSDLNALTMAGHRWISVMREVNGDANTHILHRIILQAVYQKLDNKLMTMGTLGASDDDVYYFMDNWACKPISMVKLSREEIVAAFLHLYPDEPVSEE